MEDIQDMVESKLMAMNKYALAKSYIIYRYNRALVRKKNTTDESILSLLHNTNKELAEEKQQVKIQSSHPHNGTILLVRYPEI